MKIRKKNNFFYKMTATVLCVSLALLPSETVLAQSGKTTQSWRDAVRAGEAMTEETVVIRSVDDFLQLPQDCSLDSWSVGKTVLLEADLDLTGSDFMGIPTFGGSFDGQDHTISGLSLTGSGNVTGLFRYVQKGGIVKNLKVEGSVLPVEEKSMAGGIAGQNGGQIISCSFTGTIAGKNQVGGIVGQNEAEGQLIGCSFDGSVSGESDVGGITGRNLGSVILCKNAGAVNTTEINITPEMSELELGLTGTDSLAGSMTCADIGGIAGYSSGIIQSCENSGSIGYDHMYYNVGGIVGRQSGYLDGCENTGTVLGRKDVGGIAGQLEPNITLRYDESTLNELWNELDALQTMLDGALEDAKGASSSLSDNMTALSDSVKNAKTTAGDLADGISGWVDESLETINDFTARISWALDRMDPVMDTVREGVAELEDASGQFESAFSQIRDLVSQNEEVLKNLGDAAGDFAESMAELRDAFAELDDALEELKNAVGDSEKTAAALTRLASGCSTAADCLKTLEHLTGELRSAISGREEMEKLDRALEKQQNAYGNLAAAFDTLAGALTDMAQNGENPDTDSLNTAAMQLSSAAQELNAASRAISAALDSERTKEQQALDETYERLVQFQRQLEADVDALTKSPEKETLDSLQKTISKGQEMLSELEDAAAAAQKAKEFEEPIRKGRECLEALTEQVKRLSETLGGDADSMGQKEETNGETPDGYTVDSDNDTGADAAQGIADPAEEGQKDADTPKEEQGVPSLSEQTKELLSQILETSNSFKKSMQALEKLLDGMRAASEIEGSISAEPFLSAGKSMKSGASSFLQAADSFSGIIKELREKPSISFTPLSGRIADQSDAMDAALDHIGDSVTSLNEAMDTSSDTLLEDMRVINNQIRVIADLLKREQEEAKEEINSDIEDHFQDVSDEAGAQNADDGRISGSHNAGTVQGDVNIAGIVGAMALEFDFDREDDIINTQNRSLNFSLLTSAVVTGCINTGEITAKKNCAGGIAGRMDLGKISACESYGDVCSTDGDYVGGIAGESFAVIRNCWSKCSLSGGKYIGGIAGYGATIAGCRALIDVEAYTAYVGSIAGNVEEEGTVENNLFVHATLAAVDNISYSGKAEPVSYDELLSDAETPERFKQFELVFMADGEVVEVIPFQYGEGIDRLPQIPAKSGYSAKWPDIDYSHLVFGRTLEAEYTPYESALSGDGEAMQLLVDGAFSSEAAVEHESEAFTFTDEAGREHSGTRIWVQVTDPTLSEISYTVHYKLPDSGKKYRVWMLCDDGSYEKTKCETDGSYILVKSMESQITFVLEEYSNIALIAIAVCAVLAALVVLYLLVKRRRRRRRIIHKTA
ncbi:MAG: hypothetical protein Q4C58_05510 [Eubacteriales bacterium]|nr:hypothetical protein [Eubacteriales bacterium]